MKNITIIVENKSNDIHIDTKKEPHKHSNKKCSSERDKNENREGKIYELRLHGRMVSKHNSLCSFHAVKYFVN